MKLEEKQTSVVPNMRTKKDTPIKIRLCFLEKYVTTRS